MATASNSPGLLSRLNRRLKGTGDSEPEQARLRLAIGFIVVGFLLVPWGEDENLYTTVTSVAGTMGITYYALALAIFFHIIIHPVRSQARRICGAVLDMGLLSWLMYYTGAETVWCFVIYPWVILGNGFRYGLFNLYISFRLSAIIGFGAVTLYQGEYWQDTSLVFGGQPVTDAHAGTAPVRRPSLLKKLHAAIERRQAGQRGQEPLSSPTCRTSCVRR